MTGSFAGGERAVKKKKSFGCLFQRIFLTFGYFVFVRLLWCFWLRIVVPLPADLLCSSPSTCEAVCMALFSYLKILQNFLDRIFRRMHGVLNIDKNKN